MKILIPDPTKSRRLILEPMENTLIPIPRALIPDPRLWSLIPPFFRPLIPDPIYLVTTLICNTVTGLVSEAMRTVFSCLVCSEMSEPDKKIQKEMTNAAGMIKLSIYKEKVPIYCVFVTEISRNTYSLLTTWKCCPARSSWARTRLVYVTIMRCGNHFGIFTSGQLQSRPRCWILKSLILGKVHLHCHAIKTRYGKYR